MFLIVGLGNPEKEYKNTRHNMGFDAINQLAEECNINMNQKKFKGLYGSGHIANQKVILLKPQTYMNLSGQSIKEAIDFYKLDYEDIIVIYDDMDIAPGTIKIRKKGSAGSHNGMKSVIAEIGTQEFPRIRVGIGAPEHKTEMISYVIGSVKPEELEELRKGTTKAKEAIVEILKNGIDKAMNKFN